MSEKRKMYHSLLDEPLTVCNKDLTRALEDLASGPCSFGIIEEWRQWLHYLLPRVPDLIDEFDTEQLYEGLVTAFMSQYPAGTEEKPYARFFEDVLATVGQTLMSQRFWSDGRLRAGRALSSIHTAAAGPVLFCGGAFSAALFLVIKYIDDRSMSSWWRSVVAIEAPVWRAKLMLWLASGAKVLLEDAQPASLESEYGNGAGWQWCWCLNGKFPTVDPDAELSPFLSPARQESFVAEIRHILTAEKLLEWHTALASEVAAFDNCETIIWHVEKAFDKIVASYDLRPR